MVNGQGISKGETKYYCQEPPSKKEHQILEWDRRRAAELSATAIANGTLVIFAGGFARLRTSKEP